MGDVVTFLDHGFNLATVYFHQSCGNTSLLLCPTRIYFVDGTSIQLMGHAFSGEKLRSFGSCSPDYS